MVNRKGILGTGVKSNRLVRSRPEAVCPMGSGTRGVLVLHSETSDFHFLVVCATFFSFLFEQGFRCTWMMDGVGACCPGSRGPRAESRGPRAGPPFIQCLFHKLLMKHHPHHPPLLPSSSKEEEVSHACPPSGNALYSLHIFCLLKLMCQCDLRKKVYLNRLKSLEFCSVRVPLCKLNCF